MGKAKKKIKMIKVSESKYKRFKFHVSCMGNMVTALIWTAALNLFGWVGIFLNKISWNDELVYVFFGLIVVGGIISLATAFVFSFDVFDV